MVVIESMFSKIEESIRSRISTTYRKDVAKAVEESKETQELLGRRISEHVRGYKGATDRAHMLEYIVDHITIMVCMLDMESKYKYVNDRYLKIYNKPMEEVIGYTVLEVCGERIWNAVKENHELAKLGTATSVIYNADELHGTNDIGNHIYNVQYYPYYNGGTTQVGYVMLASIQPIESIEDI